MADHLLQLFCSPNLKCFYFYSAYDIFSLGCPQHTLQLETDLHYLGFYYRKIGCKAWLFFKLCKFYGYLNSLFYLFRINICKFRRTYSLCNIDLCLLFYTSMPTPRLNKGKYRLMAFYLMYF